jgi:plastocyanin
MKTKTFRIAFITAILGFSFLAFSCKKDTAGPNAVFIQDDSFSPSSITVSKGTTITWTNKGSNTHTVTSNDALFDSGDLTGGDTFTHNFDSIGTFPYHCVHHSGMSGSVKVE